MAAVHLPPGCMSGAPCSTPPPPGEHRASAMLSHTRSAGEWGLGQHDLVVLQHSTFPALGFVSHFINTY